MNKYFLWFWRQSDAVKTFLAISISLFLCSLFFDGYTSVGGNGVTKSMPGILALLTGWGDLPSPSVAWFANPFGLTGVFLLSQQRYKAAFIVSIIAAICAFSFLFEAHVLIDEAGNFGAIVSLGPAYWLWLGSLIALVFAAVVANWAASKTSLRD
jgi:hypothetical protein